MKTTTLFSDSETAEFKDTARRMAETARLAGRRQAMNDVLRWANENKEKLKWAGLIESLVAVTSKD